MAEFHEDFEGESAVTIHLNKELFLGVVAGQVDLADVAVDGDAAVVPKFFGSFDTPTDAPVLTVR